MIERFGTPQGWAKWFERHEGVRISDGTIRKKMKEAGVIGETARNKINHLVEGSYFSEGMVRRACGNLLDQGFVQAGSDGFAEVDGVRHGSVPGLSRLLGISPEAIFRRLDGAGLATVRCKDKTGWPCEFYSEPEIRRLCADLLAELPLADEDGFIEVAGESCGTIPALAQLFGLNYDTIESRVRSSGIIPILGKGKSGRIYEYFPKTAVGKLGCDALMLLPMSDMSKFLMMDGVRYGTINGLADFLGIAKATVFRRVKGSTVRSIAGRDESGNHGQYYPEPEIRRLCADLLTELPLADESNLITVDSECHGTISALSLKLGISEPSIKKRLEEADVAHTFGRARNGNRVKFFPESAVRALCADLLGDDLRADKSGFVEVNGVRLGVVRGLVRSLGVGEKVMFKRIRNAGLVSYLGRDFKNRSVELYPEPEVRRLCADLMCEVPRADEFGFVEVDGVRLGNVSALARWFGVSQNAINHRLKASRIIPVSGRLVKGQACDFYPEPAIRELCRDLLERKKSNPKPR
jgi:hypothetical protein